jgi:hypothetical protein
MPGQPKDDKSLGFHEPAGRLEDRRDARFEVPIEIEVTGFDQNNQVFHELTSTENVSEWGCAFLLSAELKPDDIVSLRVTSAEAAEFEASHQSPFQIMRVRREKDRWLVGAYKVDNGAIWGVNLEQIARHLEGCARKSRLGVDEKPEKQSVRDADR